MLHDSLAAAFEASQFAIRVNLEGLTHEESTSPPRPAGNCVNWNLGHILLARGTVLQRLGGKPLLGGQEGEPYRRGGEAFTTETKAVELDRLRDGLEKTATEIAARLRSLDPEALEADIDPASLPVPLERATVGALLTFLLFHEGYHVGQVGLGRRLAGKPGAIR